MGSIVVLDKVRALTASFLRSSPRKLFGQQVAGDPSTDEGVKVRAATHAHAQPEIKDSGGGFRGAANR